MHKIAGQLKWLVWKNLMVAQRNRCSSLFQFLSPILVCLIVLGFQVLTNSVIGIKVVNPPVYPIDTKLSKCYKPSNCTTIGYGIVGPPTPWTEYVV